MARRYETENRGHEWQRNEDGSIDIFAYNHADPHNGPRCVKCGYGFCHRCEKIPDCDCTAVSEGEK